MCYNIEYRGCIWQFLKIRYDLEEIRKQQKYCGEIKTTQKVNHDIKEHIRMATNSNKNIDRLQNC